MTTDRDVLDTMHADVQILVRVGRLVGIDGPNSTWHKPDGEHSNLEIAVTKLVEDNKRLRETLHRCDDLGRSIWHAGEPASQVCNLAILMGEEIAAALAPVQAEEGKAVPGGRKARWSCDCVHAPEQHYRLGGCGVMDCNCRTVNTISNQAQE